MVKKKISHLKNKVAEKIEIRQEKIAKSSPEKVALFILISCGVWFLLAFGYTQYKKVSLAKKPAIVAQESSVEVETSKKESILSEITIYGQTEASIKVPMKARTNGFVEKKMVEKGTLVKKDDVIIKLSADDRTSKLKSAQSAVAQAKIVFDSTKELAKEGLSSRNELKQAESNLNQAQTNLKAVSLDIGYSNIKAPFDGFLDSINVEEGDYVSIGNDIGTIIQLSSIKITTQVPEKYITQVKKQNEARIELLSGYSTTGKITYISSVADKSTRTFAVEISIDNSDGQIQDGMTAKIFFPLSKEEATKVSSLSALTFNEAGELGLKVVDANDVVKFKKVNVIKQSSDAIWVTGIENNERVIINGQEYVKAGVKVKAVEDKTAFASEQQAEQKERSADAAKAIAEIK